MWNVLSRNSPSLSADRTRARPASGGMPVTARRVIRLRMLEGSGRRGASRGPRAGSGPGVDIRPIPARTAVRRSRAQAEPAVDVLHGAANHVGYPGYGGDDDVGRDRPGIPEQRHETGRAAGPHTPAVPRCRVIGDVGPVGLAGDGRVGEHVDVLRAGKGRDVPVVLAEDDGAEGVAVG